MPKTYELSEFRVLLLGACLLVAGWAGFFYIPGMMAEDAQGSKAVNAFYCSAVTLTTVGFGDICPGELTLAGHIFLICFALSGLGMFCGPIMQITSSWQEDVPGGTTTIGVMALAMGVSVFTLLEGHTEMDALYASIITGTTIGFGDMTPKTDLGKIAVAVYAIVAINTIGLLLAPARMVLERFCTVQVPDPAPIKEAATAAAVSVKQD